MEFTHNGIKIRVTGNKEVTETIVDDLPIIIKYNKVTKNLVILDAYDNRIIFNNNSRIKRWFVYLKLAGML